MTAGSDQPGPDIDAPSDVPTRRMLSWAKNSTIYRLGRKMMTERELFDAISRKAKEKFDGITPAQVKETATFAVMFAHEIKGLDDAAYAGIRTRSAVRSGKSKRVIARKLSAKGVDAETAAAALAESNDLFAAVVLARKRGFGPFRRGDLDEKRKVKELSAFARQGFSFEIGKQVFAMGREDAEELLLAGPQ